MEKERDGGRERERVCPGVQTEQYKQRRRTAFNVVRTILGTTTARIEHVLDKDAAATLSTPRPL